MAGIGEKRRHARAARDERVIVKLRSAGDDPSAHDEVGWSRIADLSQSGVRIRLDRPLDPGCILDLWIKVDGLPGTFLLQGEVKWSQPGEEGGCTAGIELGGDALDLQKWYELIAAEVAKKDR